MGMEVLAASGLKGYWMLIAVGVCLVAVWGLPLGLHLLARRNPWKAILFAPGILSIFAVLMAAIDGLRAFAPVPIALAAGTVSYGLIMLEIRNPRKPAQEHVPLRATPECARHLEQMTAGSSVSNPDQP